MAINVVKNEDYSYVHIVSGKLDGVLKPGDSASELISVEYTDSGFGFGLIQAQNYGLPAFDKCKGVFKDGTGTKLYLGFECYDQVAQGFSVTVNPTTMALSGTQDNPTPVTVTVSGTISPPTAALRHKHKKSNSHLA